MEGSVEGAVRMLGGTARPALDDSRSDFGSEAADAADAQVFCSVHWGKRRLYLLLRLESM